ncbi:MAG: insulinase family protein [Candidatus Omnitrophica bacterium]|nr:insulinase family protein [Candidatus Omnitrophota bacterium]
MYKKTEFNNSLTLVTNHMPGMESLAVGIWIRTGSRNENEKISGISHFLEHMLFKGTPSRDCRKLKEEIEGRGGSLNGFTSEEVSCFLAKVSYKHADVALEVLSDMVLNASIKQEELDRERGVIIEEIKMYQDLPNHHVHDILAEIMWPGNPLGFSIAGSIESVSPISRKGIVKYRDENYTSGNMVIVLCGNVDHGKIETNVQKIFSKAAKGKTQHPEPFCNNQSKPRMKVINKDTKQSHISMGLHSFGKFHKDRYSLTLLHIILGANMSSRLFENIREKKGLAYEIGADVKRYNETGAFVVHAGTEHKKAKEAIRCILKELKEIKEKHVTAGELKRAKEFFKVQLLMAMEDTVDHMLWLGEYATSLNKLPDRKEIIKKAEAVTTDDIKRVAQGIFKSSGLNIAMIGEFKDKEQKEIEKDLVL